MDKELETTAWLTTEERPDERVTNKRRASEQADVNISHLSFRTPTIFLLFLFMATNENIVSSRTVYLSTRGVKTFFTEHSGEAIPSAFTISNATPGDIFIRTKGKHSAWYYGSGKWNEVPESIGVPIRHPTMIPPRILARTDSGLTWVVATSAQPTHLDELTLQNYLSRLSLEGDTEKQVSGSKRVSDPPEETLPTHTHPRKVC
jgi:hypothetical protein